MSFDRELALEDSAATSANVSVGDVNADGHQDILLQRLDHFRKHADPVFCAFAVTNDDLAGINVDVLDAQGEAFILTETRTVEQLAHRAVFSR